MTEKGWDRAGEVTTGAPAMVFWEEKRSVGRMSYRGGGGEAAAAAAVRKSVVLWIQEEGIVCCCRGKEGKGRRREAHQPGREQASQGLFTWKDHASGSLLLVFPPYLKAPLSPPISITSLACPTKVTIVTKESPLVHRSSPLHRFGCERFPIGPDSGTNDATFVAQG